MDNVNIRMLKKWSMIILLLTLVFSLGLLGIVYLFATTMKLPLLWILALIPVIVIILGMINFIKIRKEIHALELEFFNETFEK